MGLSGRLHVFGMAAHFEALVGEGTQSEGELQGSGRQAHTSGLDTGEDCVKVQLLPLNPDYRDMSWVRSKNWRIYSFASWKTTPRQPRPEPFALHDTDCQLHGRRGPVVAAPETEAVPATLRNGAQRRKFDDMETT